MPAAPSAWEPYPEVVPSPDTDDVLFPKDPFFDRPAPVPPAPDRLGILALRMSLAERQRRAEITPEGDTARRRAAHLELERMRMRQAVSNLVHTRAPILVPAGSSMPVGWDEGMVRLAAVAASAGSDLAVKEAGIGDFVTAAKSMATQALPAIKNFGQKALTALKAPAAAGAASAASTAAPAAGNLLPKVQAFGRDVGRKLSGGFGWKANLAMGAGTIGAGLLAKKAIPAVTREMGREPAGPATYGQPHREVGYQMPYGVNEYGVAQTGTPFM